MILVDDHLHEEEEVLYLVLGTPVSTSAGSAHLGARNTTTVLIKDKADSKDLHFHLLLCILVNNSAFNFLCETNYRNTRKKSTSSEGKRM